MLCASGDAAVVVVMADVKSDCARDRFAASPAGQSFTVLQLGDEYSSHRNMCCVVAASLPCSSCSVALPGVLGASGLVGQGWATVLGADSLSHARVRHGRYRPHHMPRRAR